jgi:hypothetical protein
MLRGQSRDPSVSTSNNVHDPPQGGDDGKQQARAIISFLDPAAAYLLGLRRARAKARRQRDDLADDFADAVEEIKASRRDVRDEVIDRESDLK